MSAHSKVSSVRLEYHSLRFVKMLFKRFPQWKSYSGHYTEEKTGLSINHLDVSVPSANPNVTDALRITAYPGEIVVGWLGGAHTHFDAWMRGGAVGYMEAAIDFVERIVTDQVVFGYYVQDDKPTGVGFLYDVMFKPSPTWLNVEQGCVVMRSWNGILDAELPGQTSPLASV